MTDNSLRHSYSISSIFGESVKLFEQFASNSRICSLFLVQTKMICAHGGLN